ncbi:MAG: HAD family phosphatase [Ruminococcaceae bacterium]|nr:HAD family phosphatase [Oscillospiraceae bacterium]
MGIFDGFLFCTDLDGTLLRKDKTISDENLYAIDYFKSEGGYFTFVTGRMPFFVSKIHDRIHPNAPIGCVNGGGLYDYANQKYIWTSTMPEAVTELIQCIDDAFSDVGIQVNTFYKTYFCRENKTMQHFREVTRLPNLVCPYREVKEPIAKIVFGSESGETIGEIARTLGAHPLADQFDFIRSERTLFEILPKGIGKGTVIEKLAQYLHVDMSKTVAIGDYNNDISMFKSAGLGIAVANACPEAREAADYVTVSNEEHAIAQVIRDLENGRYV